MTDKPMDVERTLRELETKLRDILAKPVDDWCVDGKAIVHRSGYGPLIRDHAASPQSLILIAEALNFTVRRLALNNFADELKAVREALREPGVSVAYLSCPDCKSIHQLGKCREYAYDCRGASKQAEAAPPTCYRCDATIENSALSFHPACLKEFIQAQESITGAAAGESTELPDATFYFKTVSFLGDCNALGISDDQAYKLSQKILERLAASQERSEIEADTDEGLSSEELAKRWPGGTGRREAGTR